MKQCINEKTIKNLLKNHYPELIANAESLEIQSSEQGYMNFVFRINVVEQEKKNFYTVIFYNVNRYEGESAIKFLSQVYQASSFLHENGVPTRVAVKNLQGSLVSDCKINSVNRLIGIYNYLPGKTIPWEAYTRRHLHSLGRELAKIHKIWKQYKGDTSMIPEWDEYLSIDSNNLEEYLVKNNKTIELKLKISLNFNEINEIIKDLQNKAKKSLNYLIHGDFVRSNILFGDKKDGEYYPITGILDFEKVLQAPLEVDIARTLAFLITDCKYKSRKEVFEKFFDEGYVKECPSLVSISSRNFDSMKSCMIYFWLRDFWKLLQCNPYENLTENEHFVRTVQILKDNKVISELFSI